MMTKDEMTKRAKLIGLYARTPEAIDALLAELGEDATMFLDELQGEIERVERLRDLLNQRLSDLRSRKAAIERKWVALDDFCTAPITVAERPQRPDIRDLAAAVDDLRN